MATKKKSTKPRDRGNLSVTQQDEIRALLTSGKSVEEVAKVVNYKPEFLKGAIVKFRMDDPKVKSFTLSRKAKMAGAKLTWKGTARDQSLSQPNGTTSLSKVLESFAQEKARIISELRALIERIEAL